MAIRRERLDRHKRKRVRKERVGRARKVAFEDRLPKVENGPSVVASGYGDKMLGKYLVGKVVAANDAWVVIEFPDKGDGVLREAYSNTTGIRRGDKKSRGWRIDIRELKEGNSPVDTNAVHENRKKGDTKLLFREKHEYKDGTEKLVYEVWESTNGGLYLQAYRETVPTENRKRIRRKPCAVPFWVLNTLVVTFGGTD